MRMRTTLAAATVFAAGVACGWLAASGWRANVIAAQENRDQPPVRSELPLLPPEYPARYMGGKAKLATAPNGAVVYDQALKTGQEVAYLDKTVEKITDGIWLIGGYSIVNCIVIEAPDGLIVYDTGDSGEEGKQFRAVIEEKISKRPIKAIIYSHSHYALGGKAMVEDAKSVMVIGHPKLNETIKENLEAGGAPAAIPEIGPVLTARAAVQFNNFLPATGPDANLAARIELKTPAFLPVTQPVDDGQTLVVAGLKLQFFTKYTSDDYCTTVYVPEKKAVLNNFFWPGAPNFYTLRGAVYRDPQTWRDGLKVIRDLQPEYLLNTHARAIAGKQKIAETLTDYMDMITLTYDQTLRGILHGLGPDDLRYFIYKPKRLADEPYNAETYGETPWYPPAVFYYQMGWYDRDASAIFKLPPKEEARRLVALMGGREKVVARAKEALENHEYAWAAQLVDYASKLDATDAAARKVKADALRRLGQLAFGSIGRAFLISNARALEGKVRIPSLVPPQPGIIAADPATFVNFHRVRIDPRKAETVDKVLAFTFGDKTVALHIRRGIAEFVPDLAKYHRKSDITLAMDGDQWAQLYLNQKNLQELIGAGKVKVTQGNEGQAVRLLGLFDQFDPARNVADPPAHD